MSRALLCHLCSWALAGTAVASDPAASLEGRTRVELSVSAASRRSSQETNGTTIFYGGVAPTHLHLSAAHFFHPPLALGADVGLDAFGVYGTGFTGSVSHLLVATQVSATALGRWRVMEGLAAEAQAGYLFGSLPTLRAGAREVEPGAVKLGGPLLGAQVRWDAFDRLSAQAGARWLPAGLGTRTPDGRAAAAWQVQVEAAATYRLLTLGPAQLAIGPSYELAVANVSGTSSSYAYTLSQTSHRFGISIRGWLAPASAPAPGLDLPTGPGRIRGRVVREGDLPIPGARVEIPGQAPAIAGPDGRFSLEEIPPGPVALSVTATGFKAHAEALTVTPGADLELSLTLAAPHGPGTIRGTVFAAQPGPGEERRPLAGAAIQGPAGEVQTAEDGTFTLAAVGPGPVQVKASLRGYRVVEEVVSVPPEGEASLELTLVPEVAQVLASLRGQVRTLRGKPLSAVLSIPEANVRTRTGSNGRFNVRVPGGKYTVVFEARGYVSQTKTVEVADGDQAIFYVDLSREGR